MKIRGFEVVRESMRKHKGEIQLPTRGSQHAIAYDIYSPIECVIKPNERKLIFSDVKAYFQDEEALLINVRSSMGKHGIMMANSTGWVESDYYNNESNDGNLGVFLYNSSDIDFEIKVGDRIGQAMFIPFLIADNGNTDSVRKGGFGSTNK
ncbi:MAG: hypothetical protein ACRC0F_12520 [Cetobacterium sp.]